LRCEASPAEVVTQISLDRTNNIERRITVSGKASSYNYQHINEQLNLLVLANVITFDGQNIILNTKEMPYIESMSNKYNLPPIFDYYRYDMSILDERKQADVAWGKYFSKLSDLEINTLTTSTEALGSINMPNLPHGQTIDTVALGDDGEEYVYQMERARIEPQYPRLLNKLKKLGKTKGLGYDILSVYGVTPNPDFAKYIEVKSTKRVTPPPDSFTDTINLTRNEWTAAQQHAQHFYIYRVYFCQNEIKVFIIENPYEKNEQGIVYAVPLIYRMDFNETSGSFHAAS
jgi:hypothetical protein